MMAQRKDEVEITYYTFIRQAIRLKRGMQYITITIAMIIVFTIITATIASAFPDPTSHIPRWTEQDEVLVVGCDDALRIMLRFIEKF